MPITLSCSSCNKRLEAPDKYAGRPVKCPKCQTALTVPVAVPPSQPVPPPPVPVAVNSATVAAKSFCCNGCGTPLKIPKNSRGHVQCPSCRNDCVLEGLVKNAEIAAKENINSGIPLNASPAVLHRQIVSHFYKSPNIPLDVFEKAEAILEERYCVPAYCFYCNGTASFTYMAVNIRQHKTTQDLGDRSRTEWENYEEETLMNGNASASATLFAPGDKKLAQQVQQLYMQLDPDKLAGLLVDIEELDFPPDVETYTYNLPQPVSFNEYVKPHVDKLLEQKAMESLRGKNVHSLTMGGSNIQKDPVRVFLGLYRVVYKYGGQEYSMWATGDGQKVWHDKLPSDSGQRQGAIEQREADIKKLEAALTPLKSASWILGILAVCVVAAIFSFSSSVLLALLFIMGAIISGAMFYLTNERVKEENEQIAQNNEQIKERINNAKKSLETFEGQWPTIVGIFKAKKKPLRGIYAEVSGDPEAF